MKKILKSSQEDLSGAIVEIALAGHQGWWFVLQDDGGPCVRVQRPEDFRDRWVDRKFVKRHPPATHAI